MGSAQVLSTENGHASTASAASAVLLVAGINKFTLVSADSKEETEEDTKGVQGQFPGPYSAYPLNGVRALK